MWIRLLGAPRWQRWLVHCCVAAVTFGLLAPLLMPDLMAGMAWPWRLVFLVGVSVLFAQQAVIVGRRASHEYVAATRGLDRAERAQAIAASVRGDVPASAAVLVAAIRIAHLRLGFGRSTPAEHRIAGKEAWAFRRLAGAERANPRHTGVATAVTETTPGTLVTTGSLQTPGGYGRVSSV